MGFGSLGARRQQAQHRPRPMSGQKKVEVFHRRQSASQGNKNLLTSAAEAQAKSRARLMVECDMVAPAPSPICLSRYDVVEPLIKHNGGSHRHRQYLESGGQMAKRGAFPPVSAAIKGPAPVSDHEDVRQHRRPGMYPGRQPAQSVKLDDGQRFLKAAEACHRGVAFLWHRSRRDQRLRRYRGGFFLAFGPMSRLKGKGRR